MFKLIDYYARQCVAIPILTIGICLATISEWLIRAGAWIVDVDISEIKVED